MGREVDNNSATQADGLQQALVKIAQEGYQNDHQGVSVAARDLAENGWPRVDIDFGPSDGSHEQAKSSGATDGGQAKPLREVDDEKNKELPDQGKESDDTEDLDTDDDTEDLDTDDREPLREASAGVSQLGLTITQAIGARGGMDRR